MKRRGAMRPATEGELAAIWPAAKNCAMFETADQLQRYWSRAPWRVLVTAQGEAAVLDRWRAHLGVCAVRGLWCDGRRVPELIADIREVAVEQGFDALLSPLVPPEAVSSYERAGMSVFERIITLRRNPPFDAAEEPAAVRPGSCADVHAVLAVDRASFSAFWRYDAETLGAYLGTERMAVAEEDGEIVGYTLSTVKAAVGTLGRLAVAPHARGRGIGAQLLGEAMRWMGGRGAQSVTLCTQEHNATSRRLYARAGFRELPGKLVFLLSGQAPEEES